MSYVPQICLVCVVCMLLNFTTADTSAPPCGLTGIPWDTSPENLYKLPPIPENLQSGAVAWEHPIFGSVIAIQYETNAHSPYLSARFSMPSLKYYLQGNSRSKNFLREQKTRTMLRTILLKCSDNSLTKYHLEIPVQDMSPPVFGQDEYEFTISSDWNREIRPVSEGHFVTVSDIAIGLGNDHELLTFLAIPNILEIKAHPLWVLPDPDKYFYRLDLHLKDDAEVEAGKSIQVQISARDAFNTGLTKIFIHVSE